MPESNSLTYRGYAVQDLCEHKSFEDVAYLLVHDDLPDESQKAAFITNEKSHRGLSSELLAALNLLPKNAHPMDSLRTSVSILT